MGGLLEDVQSLLASWGSSLGVSPKFLELTKWTIAD